MVYIGYIPSIRNKNDIRLFFENITFYSFWVDGNNFVWFIALIVILYLFYPFLYIQILNNDRINRIRYIIFLCTIIYIGAYVLHAIDPKYYREIEIAITRIPVFLIGCYCGILAYNKVEIGSNIKLMSLIIVIAGIGYFYVYPIGIVKLYRIPYLFIGIGLSIWISICLDILENYRSNKILSKLGNLSLELYLSHVVLKALYYKSFFYGKSSVANFSKYIIIVLFGSILLSIVVYHIHKLCIQNKLNLYFDKKLNS